MTSTFERCCTDERRRTELALYCLPKSMEALWNILRRRRIVPHVPFGTELLAMAGMGMVMDTWVFERESLSSLVRAVLCVGVPLALQI